MANGTSDEMSRAKAILASGGLSRTDIYENHSAAEAARPVT